MLPDAGLILVPFSSWTAGVNYQGVQLIDLSRDALALRGRIERPIQARRATLHRDRILSLSGLEILSVDATDRDQPVIRAGTPLSWPVDRVFLSGPYLLELDQGLGTSSATELRVAPAAEPDQLLNRLSLTNLPFLGAALRGDRLYIARGRAAGVNWQWVQGEQTNRPGQHQLGRFQSGDSRLVTIAGVDGFR